MAYLFGGRRKIEQVQASVYPESGVEIRPAGRPSCRPTSNILLLSHLFLLCGQLVAVAIVVEEFGRVG